MEDTQLADIAAPYSVKVHPQDNGQYQASIADSFYFWGLNYQKDFLYRWGTKARDYQLRRYAINAYNTLVVSALTQFITRIEQTPTEISGDPSEQLDPATRKRLQAAGIELDAVAYFQELQAQAEEGQGWNRFLSKGLFDYFYTDFGWVGEIIGTGDPSTPLKTTPLGIAHLDSLRCYPSRDDEFPIYYNDLYGGWHKMHKSRIFRIVDTPHPDERAMNIGICAMSRLASIANIQYLMHKYQNEKMNDLPQTGIMAVSGMNREQWLQARERFDAESQSDSDNVYKGIMSLFPIDPKGEVRFDLIPFADMPDHFKYQEYMDIHVNLVALAIGDDPQNIWPLSGQGLGTGTQSRILHAKGQAKTFGALLTEIERVFNQKILPVPMEFKFKYTDTEKDKETAETAKVWIDIANSATMLSADEKRQLVANNVEAIRDVIVDEQGRVRLSDDDPKAPQQEQVQADDVTQIEPEASSTPDAVASNNEQSIQRSLGRRQYATLQYKQAVVYKDLQAVRLDFEADWQDLTDAAVGDDMARRRAGIVARGMANKYIRKAYEEGLIAGGVEDPPNDDDLAAISKMAAEQSTYITNYFDAIYKDDVQYDGESRAPLWWNKSIAPAYNEALLAADRDMMLEFAGEDGVESCSTCVALKGQRHRASEWAQKELRPGQDTDNYECGGWRCEHRLIRAKGKSSGNWV